MTDQDREAVDIATGVQNETVLFSTVEFVLQPLVVICAWCVDFDPRDPRNATASHGLCERCAARLNAELDAA